VKKVYAINFTAGQNIDASALDVAAGVSYPSLPNGKYIFILNGSGSAKANITNYSGSDADASHEGSNNDYYMVTVASGAVTSIVRRNDTTQEALSAFQLVMTEQGNRITALEGVNAENAITLDGGIYRLGGALMQNTDITGNYDLHVTSRLIADHWVVKDLSNPAKFYRIAVQNDEIVFGETTAPN
jgi:hypothetical protein